MKLKIATHNISGGFYDEKQDVDYLDKTASELIDFKMLEEIIENINRENIDIICFQEIITTKKVNYISTLMKRTNLKYENHFELSPCNIVKNTQCGVAILSRYPIERITRKTFTNPMLSKTTASGKTYYTFNKGFLFSKVNTNNGLFTILTHHEFPFRRFNSTPEAHLEIFTEFDNYIKQLKPDFIAGDFNSENFLNMMPYAKSNYIKTITKATTKDGMKFDNILLKNGCRYSSKIMRSLSDHFLVIDEVEF